MKNVAYLSEEKVDAAQTTVQARERALADAKAEVGATAQRATAAKREAGATEETTKMAIQEEEAKIIAAREKVRPANISNELLPGAHLRQTNKQNIHPALCYPKIRCLIYAMILLSNYSL